MKWVLGLWMLVLTGCTTNYCHDYPIFGADEFVMDSIKFDRES